MFKPYHLFSLQTMLGAGGRGWSPTSWNWLSQPLISRDFLPDSSSAGLWKESPVPTESKKVRPVRSWGAYSKRWASAVSLWQHFQRLSGSPPCLDLGTEPRLSQSNYFTLWRTDFTLRGSPGWHRAWWVEKDEVKKHCQAAHKCPILSNGGKRYP